MGILTEEQKKRKAAYNKARYEANKDRILAASKAWYEANKDRRIAASKAWYEANKDRYAETNKAWRERNKDHMVETDKTYLENNKKKRTNICRAWVVANPAAMNALRAKRRAVKRQSTPAWANFAKIKAVYDSALRVSKCLGIKFHVDHIIPLRGAKVSGLHVESNLQILSQRANNVKGNKF